MLFPTLDSIWLPIKIKIVGQSKTLFGAELQPAAPPPSVRPVTLRCRRDHGGGLWTFEDQDGQLYLAVFSPYATRELQKTVERQRASGAAYGWRSRATRRKLRNRPDAA